MANSLGSAYVQIVPSAQGISGSIQKVINPEATKAGQTGGTALVSKMKGLIAGAAIGTTIVAGIKKSIGEGAALEQSLGGIETLFKGSANTVIKNASKAFKTAGVSANQYMENVTSFSASLISSLDGDTAKAAKVADVAMRDMSDNANKMGTDIGSIQQAYQGFARGQYQLLDNLKLGYGGTKTEMARLLEDAGKISGQKYDMSNLSDVYEAIHVIQGELDITGTTANEAATTIAGSFGSLKAAFSDFMGNLALGRDIGPSMKNLVDSAVTFLVGNLIPAIGRIMKSLPTAIGAGIKATAAYIPKNLTSVIGKGLDAITAKMPSIMKKGSEMIVNLGNGLMERLPSLLEQAAQIVGKFANFLAENYPVIVEAGIKMVSGLAKGLVKNGPAILAAVAKLALQLGKAFIKWQVMGLKAGVQILKAVASGIGSMVGSLVGKVKGVVDKVIAPFKGMIDKVRGFFPINLGNIFGGIKLPHFTVSGGTPPFGLMGKGTPPKFNVSFYAKGGIMDQPTLFGLAGGEAGPEAILPLDPFWKRLDEMKGGNTFNISMQVDGAENPENWADRFARRLELEVRGE